jgi:hypothetical protein
MFWDPSGPTKPQTDGDYTVDTDNEWTWGNHPDMSKGQFDELKLAILKRKSAFAYASADLTGYTGDYGDYTMPFDDEGPTCYQKPRRLNPFDMEIANEKCKEMLAAGTIAEAPKHNKYASNPVVVAKKDINGIWIDQRVCIDYRDINKRSKTQASGMPRPDDLFQKISDHKFFTKLDMKSGFHQCRLGPDAQMKTAF